MSAQRMSIEQKYGVKIWKSIKSSASKYSNVPLANISPKTRADELFDPKTDDGKNRYGQVLFDTFEYITEISGEELSIDYEGRSEFTHFPKLEDAWIYFINKLEDKSKKGIIFPFPTQNK